MEEQTGASTPNVEQNEPEERLWSTKELADELGVSKYTVIHWCSGANPRVHALRPDHWEWRIPQAEVDRLKAERNRDPGAALPHYRPEKQMLELTVPPHLMPYLRAGGQATPPASVPPGAPSPPTPEPVAPPSPEVAPASSGPPDQAPSPAPNPTPPVPESAAKETKDAEPYIDFAFFRGE